METRERCDDRQVAAWLGLPEGLDSPALRRAAACWPQWAAQHPQLEQVPNGLADLRDWLLDSPAEVADEVLHTLARLAARDGDADPAALAVLVWAVLPGAARLAGRLRRLGPNVGEVVAAQLWIQASCYPWRRRPARVAANLLADTRRQVMAELGVGRHGGVVWSRTLPVDPTCPWWAARPDQASPAPEQELAAVLTWTVTAGVITADDRQLLLDLAANADETRALSGRGTGGLLATAVTARVALRHGVSAKTVQRRATRTLGALTRACSGTREKSA